MPIKCSERVSVTADTMPRPSARAIPSEGPGPGPVPVPPCAGINIVPAIPIVVSRGPWPQPTLVPLPGSLQSLVYIPNISAIHRLSYCIRTRTHTMPTQFLPPTIRLYVNKVPAETPAIPLVRGKLRSLTDSEDSPSIGRWKERGRTKQKWEVMGPGMRTSGHSIASSCYTVVKDEARNVKPILV